MSLFLFVFCGVIVGGVSGYGLWTYYTKAPSSPGTMPSKEESLAACEELKAEWKPAGLPIEVGPLQAMYFYGIREKNIEYFVYRNDFNFVRHWPTDEQVYPNEMLSTGALNVTNSCALTVYAIEIKIVVEHGKTFSTDNIKIEALRPSKSFTVYFVNQSDAAAHVHLPDAVIAELEGGTGQKSLRMTTKGFYSQVSPLLPEILSPTFHEWKGNVLINPGKAKNNGGMKRQGEQ